MNKREKFFATLDRNTAVNPGVLRALTLYYANRKNKHLREAIDADMADLARVCPQLSLETGAKFHKILKGLCYLHNGAWRATQFTELWGSYQRRVFDNFGHIELVGFYDDQTSGSLSWELRNRAGYESASAIPIYRIVSREGETIDFILRNWQRGGIPIEFI